MLREHWLLRLSCDPIDLDNSSHSNCSSYRTARQHNSISGRVLTLDNGLFDGVFMWISLFYAWVFSYPFDIACHLIMMGWCEKVQLTHWSRYHDQLRLSTSGWHRHYLCDSRSIHSIFLTKVDLHRYISRNVCFILLLNWFCHKKDTQNKSEEQYLCCLKISGLSYIFRLPTWCPIL